MKNTDRFRHIKQIGKSYKEILADNLKREKGKATPEMVKKEIKQSQLRSGYLL